MWKVYDIKDISDIYYVVSDNDDFNQNRIEEIYSRYRKLSQRYSRKSISGIYIVKFIS